MLVLENQALFFNNYFKNDIIKLMNKERMNSMQLGLLNLSALNANEEVVNATSKTLINAITKALGVNFKKITINTWDSTELNIIFIRTGGVEQEFLKITEKVKGPYYILTSNNSNSLAASLEVASYLRQKNEKFEIFEGDPEKIAERIKTIYKITMAKKSLKNTRLAMIGEASDWLIASNMDEELLKAEYGIEVVHIPMEEFLIEVVTNFASNDKLLRELMSKFPEKEVAKVFKVYGAFKSLIRKYKLDGVTIRCFDLIEKSKTTACIALAILNKEGISASCEGDLASLVSMHITRKLLNISSFQANPCILKEDELVLAHCTIPLDMVDKYTFDTHFESNQGIAIVGEVKEQEATIFKISPKLDGYVAYETFITKCLKEKDLCRTQLAVKIDDDFCKYLLNNPYGNHHLVLLGHHKELLDEFFK